MLNMRRVNAFVPFNYRNIRSAGAADIIPKDIAQQFLQDFAEQRSAVASVNVPTFDFLVDICHGRKMFDAAKAHQVAQHVARKNIVRLSVLGPHATFEILKQPKIGSYDRMDRPNRDEQLSSRVHPSVAGPHSSGKIAAPHLHTSQNNKRLFSGIDLPFARNAYLRDPNGELGGQRTQVWPKSATSLIDISGDLSQQNSACIQNDSKDQQDHFLSAYTRKKAQLSPPFLPSREADSVSASVQRLPFSNTSFSKDMEEGLNLDAEERNDPVEWSLIEHEDILFDTFCTFDPPDKPADGQFSMPKQTKKASPPKSASATKSAANFLTRKDVQSSIFSVNFGPGPITPSAEEFGFGRYDSTQETLTPDLPSLVPTIDREELFLLTKDWILYPTMGDI